MVSTSTASQRWPEMRARGLRPRACYLVTDFSNPSGVSLDLDTRHALLDLAIRKDLLLLEYNPYGYFSPDPPNDFE